MAENTKTIVGNLDIQGKLNAHTIETTGCPNIFEDGKLWVKMGSNQENYTQANAFGVMVSNAEGDKYISISADNAGDAPYLCHYDGTKHLYMYSDYFIIDTTSNQHVINLPNSTGTLATQEWVNSAVGSGTPGEPGYTPIKGVDYWTESDKAEIKAYVDEAILGGSW